MMCMADARWPTSHVHGWSMADACRLISHVHGRIMANAWLMLAGRYPGAPAGADQG